MADIVIASNTSIKVSRAISGAATIASNAYAIITYTKTSITTLTGSGGVEYGSLNPDTINRYFGPSTVVPNTFSQTVVYGSANVTVVYTLLSGVEFINSP